MCECLPLIMQLINQIRVALIEKEKKFPRGFLYWPKVQKESGTAPT